MLPAVIFIPGAVQQDRIKHRFTVPVSAQQFIIEPQYSRPAVLNAVPLPLASFFLHFSFDIFKDMGTTELKKYASEHYAVNADLEKFFTSEKSDNYRVAELSFKVRNLSPFKVEIPKFVVSKVDSQYSNNIGYIETDLDENGKDIPITVSAFSTEKITIRVVINTAEMTEKELNEAVSSMIISTKGMNKKVFGISIPCVPYFIFVSNNIWLDLD